MTTYTSFAAGQGVLVDHGGGWNCSAFGSPCVQDVLGSSYGPITGIATAGTSNLDGADAQMYLQANINLAANEFAGATSMSYTIKWHAVATSQGGNPSEIIVWTSAGKLPRDSFPDTIPYNTADGILVTHSGGFGSHPTSIGLHIETYISKFDGARITFAFTDVSFEIHDVVYSVTSTSETSSAVASSGSSHSSSSSSTTLATNSTTSLSSSISFTTTISAHATIIHSIPSQSLSAFASQSHQPSPSNAPNKNSLRVTEFAGIIAGSLIGLGLILIAVAFWYQWWRRRRMLHSEETSYGDVAEQNEVYPEARMTDRKLGANRRRREGNGSSIFAFSSPPPTYTQPSTRLTTMSLPSSVTTED